MLKSFAAFLLFSLLASGSLAASNPHGISSSDISVWAKVFFYMDKGQYDAAVSESSKASDSDIKKLALWMKYSKGNGNNYNEIMDFARNNPGWPDQRALKNRAEDTLNDTTDPRILVKIFTNEPPVTGRVMRLLAEAKIATGGKDEEINQLLRQAWLQGSFSASDERAFLNRHQKRIRSEDTAKRIDRLLWENKIAEAKNLMGMVDENYRRLFTARISLKEDKKGAESSIGKVPASLRSDPGFLFELINFHFKRKNYDKVHELLLPVKGELPYPEKWWSIQNRIVRELMSQRKYKAAYQIATKHANGVGTAEFAEAEWLSGWLALRFMNNPFAAYEHFYAQYQSVNFPVSKSRAAYWAARAAEANNNPEIAEKWYILASDHPTTFYGQLAFAKLQPNTHVTLPAFPKASNDETQRYQRGALLKSAYLFTTVKEYKMAEKFLFAAIDNASSPQEMAVISQLGNKIKRPDLSVNTAKHAIKKEVVLSNTGWPLISGVPTSKVEEPLVLGISRQESSFYVAARSQADARGMMQLLPSTAKLVAKKYGIAYQDGKLLTDPVYNMRLGSYYLGDMIDNFNGSYILAIASYNAGPANVKKWLNEYGDPRLADNVEDALDWMESIPFFETRSYVQRVLENMQVYRTLTKSHTHTIEEDILRSYNR